MPQFPICLFYYLTLRSDGQSAREKQERRRANFPPGLRNISYYDSMAPNAFNVARCALVSPVAWVMFIFS